MDRAETARTLAVLRAAYPNFYRGMGKAELEDIVDLWASMFEDDPFELVAGAVKAFIATDNKGFPPVIGVIKEKLRQISQPPMMTEQEAWQRVLKAIRDSAYRAREEFDALPPLLRSLVGSPQQLRDWGMMDETTVQSVVASNFMRSYRARVKYQADFDALPGDVKQLALNCGHLISLDTAIDETSTAMTAGRAPLKS